jgi:hypothetical protein
MPALILPVGGVHAATLYSKGRIRLRWRAYLTTFPWVVCAGWELWELKERVDADLSHREQDVGGDAWSRL